MAKYKKSVVFFLDILNFKNIIDDQIFSVDEIINQFKEIEYHTDYQKFANKYGLFKSLRKQKKSKNVLQCSDSIVISFDYKEPSQLFYSLFDIIILQANFAIKYNILFRGACTIGNLYHNKNLIFGNALNEAVKNEKELAKYPRIIIPKEIVDICANFSSNENHTADDEKEYILSYLKEDEDGYYYTDYLSYDSIGDVMDSDEEWADYMINLRNFIVKSLETIIDETILNKYIWLKNKYNEALTDTIITNYINNFDIFLERI